MKYLANADSAHYKFLEGIADGLSMEAAGKAAGFANPYRDLRPLLFDPDGKAFIVQRLRDKISSELAPKCLKMAEAMLDDRTLSARVKWDIIKTLLAAGAGIVAPKAEAMEAPPKEISNMSGAEIAEFRRKLEIELINRSSSAMVIDQEPTPTPQDIESLM